MDKFINYIKGYIELSARVLKMLSGNAFSSTKPNILKVRIACLRKVKPATHLYYLAARCNTVRSYFYSEGKDITHWIYLEGNLILTSWSKLFTAASLLRNTLKLRQDSTSIISINYDDMQELYLNTFPELGTISED